MVCAYLANDLQLLSRGRFMLGLGTQIRPHIETPLQRALVAPNARMREFVRALRAIWRAWETGERLDFRGEFYTHTLMTPFFNPGPEPLRTRRAIFLAGFGPAMIARRGRGRRRLDRPSAQLAELRARRRLAGARAGTRARAAARGADFEIACQTITMVGSTDEEIARAREKAQGADRLLRIDAGVPRHARPPRLGRPAAAS